MSGAENKDMLPEIKPGYRRRPRRRLTIGELIPVLEQRVREHPTSSFYKEILQQEKEAVIKLGKDHPA